MRRGAVEVLGKPEDTGSWRQLADTLPEMVRTAAVAQARPERPGRPGRPGRAGRALRTPKRQVRRPPAAETVARSLRWVGIGASTGGPAALRELLEATPVSFPYTLLVVQHITGGFEAGLADWLNREFPFDVRLAADGELPPPGSVRLAPGGSHLLLETGGTLRLDRTTGPRSGHRPAADLLLSSMAASHPRSSAGVILTGMGSDGVEGLAELRAAGGLAIAQDEASCVVYGMPRVAVEREAAEIELSPRQIGQYLAGVPRRPGKVS
jgi:two-component system chemotaxis response regulator CheB